MPFLGLYEAFSPKRHLHPLKELFRPANGRPGRGLIKKDRPKAARQRRIGVYHK